MFGGLVYTVYIAVINKNDMKDNRKTYRNQEIKLEGNVVRFDGKFNPDKNELKVYRYYGDIRLMDDAMQNFAIEHRIDTVVLVGCK